MRTNDLTYGEDYWNSFDGGAGYVDSTMWEDLAHIIKETFCIEPGPPGRDAALEWKALDVGCARGYLVKHLTRRGISSYGLDYSRWAIENCDPDVRDRVWQHDLTEARAINIKEPYRLITCFETMEHIAEGHVDMVLRRIRDALEPGGVALFTICLADREGWDSDPTHVTIHNRPWWLERLARAGFEALEHHERQLRRWWLFQDHNGIFVARKGQL